MDAHKTASPARPPALDAPAHEWARFYAGELRFALVPIPPGTKGPELPGWNRPGGYITDPAEAAKYWRAHPREGMGAVLRPSGIVTFDLDALDGARSALAAVKIDVNRLLADDPVQIEGNPTHAKAIYRHPPGNPLDLRKLTWPNPDPTPTKDGKERPRVTVFELRGGLVQDVLPPTIHPDTKRPYAWRGRMPWDGIPELPAELLDLWRWWEELHPVMVAACPWRPATEIAATAEDVPQAVREEAHRVYTLDGTDKGDWDALRAELRRRVPLHDALVAAGAKHVRGKLFLCPFHEEKHPSCWTFDAGGTQLWYCSHGNAPVGIATSKGGSFGDVVDLHQHAKKLSSPGKAAADLARKHGIPLPKSNGTAKAERNAKNKNNGQTTDGGKLTPTETITDTGNAERLVRQHGQDLRFCWPWAKWLAWDGKRWATDASGEAMRRAKATARAIYREAAQEPDDKLRAALVSHARSSESKARREAMLSLAAAELGIPVKPEDLDRDPWALNVLNGTLDLKTGELRPHRREDMITKLAPVIYDSAATCPTFERFLREIMGDRAHLVEYLQRWFGYVLTGSTREHVLPFWFGTGANGKSTLAGVLRDVLGADYSCEAPPELILAKANDQHPTERATLFGKRLVATTETQEGRKLAEVLVKQLTGGDRISARRMREDFWDFAPTHKLVLLGNHKPVIHGTDLGIWRRVRLIPFEVSIPEERQDKALPEKLRAELPGILAWGVRGCLDWHRLDSLADPAEVLTATAEYRQESDAVGDFLADRCILDSASRNLRAKAGDLYDAYKEWHEETQGGEPLTQRGFGLRLAERGCTQDRTKTARWWVGVGLQRTGAGDA